MKTSRIALGFLMMLGLACDTESFMHTGLELNHSQSSHLGQPPGPALIQTTTLLPFLPAGEFGGPQNVLIPGTFFPPDKSRATLERDPRGIQFEIQTSGLPAGAYTIWYLIFNDPSACAGRVFDTGQCGSEADFFLSSVGVVWATGNVVTENGIGKFRDRLEVGETRSETVLLGSDLSSPLENVKGAEVHLIVKYHGPASDDPAVLYDQTHTLLGSCGEDEGANSFDAGDFGIQCFDPQFAIFPAP